jgi:protein O-GlcNAc transferase
MNENGKIVISFCIYGSNKKYCKGLCENLEIMKNHMKNFYAFIYVAPDVPESYIETYKSYEFAKLFYTNISGAYNMMKRFLAIDEPDVQVMIVRDADSRLHNRDRTLIEHFVNSSYLFHAIRDHPFHHKEIMGGLFGIKKGAISVKMTDLIKKHNPTDSPNGVHYDYDQEFLRIHIYPIVKDKMIVYVYHPNMKKHGETVKIIPFLLENQDYCGLAIDYDEFGNETRPYEWSDSWVYDLSGDEVTHL